MNRKFDLGLPHTQLYLTLGHGYGHVEVVIRNLIELEYNSNKPDIRITMQTGGDHGTSYAWNFGVDSVYGYLHANMLIEAAKIMKRIEKKFHGMTDDFGSPATYAEYCQRFLLAAGINTVFVRQERDHRAVDELPQLRVKQDAIELRNVITKMEQRCLMETDSTYRDQHRQTA